MDCFRQIGVFGCRNRLVKELRLAGRAESGRSQRLSGAKYLPQWERQFTVEARQGTDLHRPSGQEQDLAAILSRVEERIVAPDYTTRHQGRICYCPTSVGNGESSR